MRTDIKWAGRIESQHGGGLPGLALGAPDGMSAGVFPGQSATYAGWRRASYEGLSDLLGSPVVGDRVTPELLSSADLIAFEMNGSGPGPGAGWESATFEFRDSQGAVTVSWVDDPAAVRDLHVIANGTISGDRYGAFFGIPPRLVTTGEPTLTQEQVRVSYLLLRIRGEIDVTGPAFRLTLSGLSGAIPDPDALGVLLHADLQPARPIKPSRSATRQVLELCRQLRTEDAISPALHAVWRRRASGQPPRGVFESHIYTTFDRMTPAESAAIEHGFSRFAEFRALGTAPCLFSDRLAAVVTERPLEAGEFAEEFLRVGLGVSTQALSPATENKPGPGASRPWRGPKGPDDHAPPPALPTPHITAVRRDRLAGSEFISSSSVFPAPGDPVPMVEEYQLAKTCELRQTLTGLIQDCHVVEAGPPPPGGLVPTLNCEGGGDYVLLGRRCLRLLARPAGGTLVIRGFNFTTPTVAVHLQAHDQPQAPVTSVDGLVLGDTTTPAVDGSGQPIADRRVSDYVDVALPRDEPGTTDTPFSPGLYDLWVSVLDSATDPAHPTTRVSNRLVVRIEPREDLTFQIVNSGGRCVETTSGPGDDEIWWTAYVTSVVPNAEPGSSLDVRDVQAIHLNFDGWSDMEDGKAARYDRAVELWPPRRFQLGEVGAIGLVGIEVDDEDEARDMLRGFWAAFGQALKAVALGAIGAVTVGESLQKVLSKAGLQVTVSLSAAVAGAAVAAAITVTAMSLWSAWAPADIVGFDLFTFDALSLSLATDGRHPLPATTERSWHVEEEWQRVRERPQPKIGTAPGSRIMTWVQENEYLSGAEDSRYVLELRVNQVRLA
jgi:hypothetical protein